MLVFLFITFYIVLLWEVLKGYNREYIPFIYTVWVIALLYYDF